MEQTPQDRIRERAYHLWNDGCGQGDETFFWVMAEREVSAEIAAESLLASASPGTARPVQSTPPNAAVRRKARASTKSSAKAGKTATQTSAAGAPPSSALSGSPPFVPIDTEMMTQGKPTPAKA